MRKILLFFFLLHIPSLLQAEEIKIKSFSMQMEPMTVPMQRKDNNGNICALVKVILPSPKATFEGNVIGTCDYKTSEYWCYLSPGSKHIKVKFPGYEPLMINFDNLIGGGVKSKQVYEIVLSLPTASNQTGFTVRGIVKLASHEAGGLTIEKLRESCMVARNYNFQTQKADEIVDLSSAPFGIEKYNRFLKFKIDNVHIGDSLLFVSKQHEPQLVVMTDENTGKEINVELPLRVYDVGGKVVDALTGRPIQGIMVKWKNPRHTGDYVSRTSDENGRFEFKTSYKWGKSYCIINAGDTIYPVETQNAQTVGYKNLVWWNSDVKQQYLGLHNDNVVKLMPYQLKIKIKNLSTSELANVKVIPDGDASAELDSEGNIVISPCFQGMSISLSLPGYKTLNLIPEKYMGHKDYEKPVAISFKKGDSNEIITRNI